MDYFFAIRSMMIPKLRFCNLNFSANDLSVYRTGKNLIYARSVI